MKLIIFTFMCAPRIELRVPGHLSGPILAFLKDHMWFSLYLDDTDQHSTKYSRDTCDSCLDASEK